MVDFGFETVQKKTAIDLPALELCRREGSAIMHDCLVYRLSCKVNRVRMCRVRPSLLVPTHSFSQIKARKLGSLSKCYHFK